MTQHRPLVILLVIISLLLSLTANAGSSILDKKVSLQVNNQPISAVLHQLERMAGVNFAYMGGLIDKNKTVNITVNQATIKSVLQKLITNPDVMLYVLDNRIIFYQKDAPPPAKNGTSVSLVIPVTKLQPKIETIIDTQYLIVTDTQHIFVSDTTKIILHDTIVEHKTIYDTIKFRQNVVDSLQSKHLRFIGFYGGLCVPPSESALATEPYHNNEIPQPIYTMGFSVEWQKGKWGLSTGLGVERHQWQANYQYNAVKTDYSKIISFNKETHWEYIPLDTVILEYGSTKKIIYVYDSTRVIEKTPVYKKDTINTDYQKLNQAIYINLPLQLHYNVTISPKFEIAMQAGCNIHFLAHASGQTLLNTATGNLLDLNEGLKSYFITTNLLLTVNYKIADSHYIGLQSGIRLPVSSQFQYTPISIKPSVLLALTYRYLLK